MPKPVFVLGVGCQKGGTTWLHAYLARRAGVAMSLPKELHVFDNRFRPDLTDPQAVPILAEMVREPGRYRDFFLGLSRKARIVGEITPAYSVLGAEHFAEIRALMSADFDMRVIFLMRDPVERIWSSAKMNQRIVDQDKTPEDVFAALLSAPDDIARTRYDLTVEALTTAFPQEELFLGFYETLFTDDTVRELCKFLTLDFVPGPYGSSVHRDPTGRRLEPRLAVMARNLYAPTYDYCARRFGSDFIRSIWRNA